MVSDLAPANKKHGDGSPHPLCKVSHDNVLNVMTFVPAMKENVSSLTMCGTHIPQDFLDAMPKIREALFEDFEQGNSNRVPSSVQTHLRKLAKFGRIISIMANLF